MRPNETFKEQKARCFTVHLQTSKGNQYNPLQYYDSTFFWRSHLTKVNKVSISIVTFETLKEKHYASNSINYDWSRYSGKTLRHLVKEYIFQKIFCKLCQKQSTQLKSKQGIITYSNVQKIKQVWSRITSVESMSRGCSKMFYIFSLKIIPVSYFQMYQHHQ